jgi:hypothetical protein
MTQKSTSTKKIDNNYDAKQCCERHSQQNK